MPIRLDEVDYGDYLARLQAAKPHKAVLDPSMDDWSDRLSRLSIDYAAFNRIASLRATDASPLLIIAGDHQGLYFVSESNRLVLWAAVPV